MISRLRSLYEDSNDNIDGELNSGVYTVVVENYAWALKMQDPKILRFLCPVYKYKFGTVVGVYFNYLSELELN